MATAIRGQGEQEMGGGGKNVPEPQQGMEVMNNGRRGGGRREGRVMEGGREKGATEGGRRGRKSASSSQREREKEKERRRERAVTIVHLEVDAHRPIWRWCRSEATRRLMTRVKVKGTINEKKKTSSFICLSPTSPNENFLFPNKPK